MAGTQLTIYPTLVVGLGGTGTNIARYAKRRFLRTWNKSRRSRNSAELLVELPAMLQVLSVDTEPLVNEPGAEPLYHHEFAFLGRFDATRLVKNKANHAPYLDWWQWGEQDIPLGYIHNGAKQLRPVGRLAFFRNYVVFRRALSDKLVSINQSRYIDEAQDEGFGVADGYRIVYIVSSLCGGTGAGMFLDAAHVVRHQVGANAHVIGIFMMPSVFENEIHSDLQRRRIQANAYAALRELNHFHSDPSFQMHYPSEQGPIPDTPYRAFNQIFLVERRNAAGRTLSSKSAAEQMAAHFIHLTAFSHLNKSILGLDVNVTEERTAALKGQLRSYLSYSSFGVSSLVVPRAALWQYYTARAAQMVAYRTFSSHSPDINTGYWPAYQGVIGEIRRLYRSFAPRTEDLDDPRVQPAKALERLSGLQGGVNRSEGYWNEFQEVIHEVLRQTFVDHGLYGLRALLARLQLRPGEAGFRPDDLGHPNQRPVLFADVPVARGPRFRLLMTPEQLVEARRNDIVRQGDVLARESWDALVENIRSYAAAVQQQVDGTIAEQNALLESYDGAVQRVAAEISPHRSVRRDTDASTLYDLETGAIGPEHLEEFWQATSYLLDLDVQQGGERRVDQIMRRLFDGIAQPHDALNGLIDAEVQTALVGDAELRALVQAAFDVRNVVQIQQRAANRPPNHRVNQVMNRLAPHAAVDGDTYYYSEANQEPIQLITALPPAPPDGNSPGNAERQREYETALRNYTQFRSIEADDLDRVDAVHIAHGIPVAYLNSIPQLYLQYSGNEFDRRMLHLDPRWPSALSPLFPTEPLPSDPLPPPAGPSENGTSSPPPARPSPPDASGPPPSGNGASGPPARPAGPDTPNSPPSGPPGPGAAGPEMTQADPGAAPSAAHPPAGPPAPPSRPADSSPAEDGAGRPPL